MLWQEMQAALAAQTQGRLDAAAFAYRRVLEKTPKTFDALHMLGVVEFQLGRLDEAEALILDALKWRANLPAAHQNLELVRAQRRAQDGMESRRRMAALDMLALFAANGALDLPACAPVSLSGENAIDQPVHIVVPGDVLNPGAQRDGLMISRRLEQRAECVVWRQGVNGMPDSQIVGGRLLDPKGGVHPEAGIVVLCGLDARMLEWLGDVGARLSEIYVLLDVQDPYVLLGLLDVLDARDYAKLRFVARADSTLAFFGLSGIVDPWLLGSRPTAAKPERSSVLRVGVFIPPTRGPQDKERWAMLEWLRQKGLFLSIAYPGPLPSAHVANSEEHLRSLVTDWTDDWYSEIDLLFYWGADGRMRQYDRLVHEAHACGVRIVADAHGDYAAALAATGSDILFFSAAEARRHLAGALPQGTASARLDVRGDESSGPRDAFAHG